MSNVIAVLCSDLHLSHTAPLARSSEPSWYDAMARVLGELSALAEKHNAPVICAGDIFDRWNSPPELINFAIKHLPKMYAIPGQHDLPHHQLEDIRRSAYWTLVEAAVILPINERHMVGDIVLWGFPWGKDIAFSELWRDGSTEAVHIAVAHQYVWEGQCKYDGAPKEKHISNLVKQLKGYDVAVFGDNHKGFQAQAGDCTVFNCGTFIRRKADEIGYKPQVGLLYDNGTVEIHYLDTSQDKIEAVEKSAANDELDITAFVEELNKLGGDSLDFQTAVERYVEKHGVKKPIREIIQRVLEGE